MAKVAVIIPSYNHAHYLPQRIESVLGQTYGDFELIILDDASPDDSQKIISRYRNDARVRVECNQVNSGSTYLQWKKGIALTTGDYIWIAESDDYADPTLLSHLVQSLEANPTAGMAVCESMVTDVHGNYLGIYGDLLKKEKAFSSFAAPMDASNCAQNGRGYCAKYMVPWNTIPNASAVLFRRAALDAIGGPVTDMKICGDWFTYCKILMMFDICREAKPLNFFRTHQNNVRSKTKNSTFMEEQRRVRAYVSTELQLQEDPKHRAALLLFESQLMIGSERQLPDGKVPLRRVFATLASTAKYGPELFMSTLAVLTMEHGATILKRLGLRKSQL